ncbi:hypothetical protein CcaverHIS002_0309170 [Cutaneotrichosporon cavernicola]|nr:hypothetical protein CcaverHIS002_0309170 [Cutaneotrichosporon cavernicola]
MTPPRPSSRASWARAGAGAAASSSSNPRPTHDDIADVLGSLPAPPPRAAQAFSGPIRSPAPSPDSADVGEIHPLHPAYRAQEDLNRPRRPWADSRETLSRTSSVAGSLHSDESDTAHLTADTLPAGIGVAVRGQLRGRTLGVFSASNPIRRAMNSAVLFPWTDPIIMVLILANLIILIIQAAPPVFTPRSPGGGYFRAWEDYALFVLFVIFTIEMFARIIVTGLIADPETSMPSFMQRVREFVVFKANADVDPAARPSTKEAWHRTRQMSTSGGSRSYTTQFMPFDEAVTHQRSLVKDNRPYLRHSWHRIDMVAIVAFWITFILAMTGQEVTENRHLYLFRAISILRTARLLVVTSGTATILHSLKRAGPLILNVSFLIVFAAALFSIIGVQSFRGSLRRTCILPDPNDPSNNITLGNCGGFLDPTTLTPTSFIKQNGVPSSQAPKGFICPINQICQTGDKSLEDDTESFDNIFKSLVQVLIIAGVNTWTNTMYETMDTDYQASALFFIVAIMVLNLWLMNLLVAVVVNTFQDIRAETKKSAFGGESSAISAPQWAQDSTRKPKEPSRVFTLYRKTEPFWVLLILLDVIAQGTKAANSSPWHMSFLRQMGLAFGIIWPVEIALRYLTYVPDWRAFFKIKRNDFDLLLAIGSAITELVPAVRQSQYHSWLTVFDLLRWYRVILLVPRMKPLLVNIFGSFTGLFNMVVFLFLMTLLAALMGVQFLRGDLPEGDAMINFSQVYNSFVGMYQIFSTENWTVVLYSAVGADWGWGQGWIVCIFLFLWFMFANFIMMQMFIAVINENFSVAEEQKRKQQVDAFIRRSEPESSHSSFFERFNPYNRVRGRHRAIHVSEVPQNLILPLKQTIGQDVGDGDVGQELATGKAAIKRLMGITADGKVKLFGWFTKKKKATGSRRNSTRVDHDGDSDDDRGLTDLLPPINPGISVDEHRDALRERRNQEADFISAHPTYDLSLYLISQKNPLRKFCQHLVPSSHGHRIFGQQPDPMWSFLFKCVIFLSVTASIAMAAIATPLYRRQFYVQHGMKYGWFDYAEGSIALVFFIEFLIKIIADGFIFTPNAYLYSVWNVVDFFILILLLTNTISSLVTIGGMSRLTRSFKAFRALRLITVFRRLRDTVYVVFFAGFVRILDAACLMILYIIPFAIWGLNIFRNRMTGCNDGSGNIGGRSDCVGEFLSSPIDNSLEFLAPRAWGNPTFDGSKWSFDDFRRSMLILFEIVSLEGWTDVMSSAMNIVGQDQQPQTNAQQWNSIFFIIFNLFGGVVILTVFLTIIIENFSISSGTALLTTEQRQWVDLKKYIHAQTPSQLPKKKPRTRLRLWCYQRATTKRGYWQRFFTFVYCVHILLLMCEDYSENIMSETQLDTTFLVLTVLYAVDIVVRFIGLGFKAFRSNGWNLFDVIVVAGSFATTIPALQASASGVEGNQASKQVQKLFLVAIALKLVQRLDALNQLFKTSIASLPAIGNLFMLWAVLFLFAAIIYLEVFGLTKQGPNAASRFQNYNTFVNSLIMLAFMSTGEGWNGYMHDYTVQFPHCVEGATYLDSDCGSEGWAYTLFIAWNILSMYIFLNMFTGVVVQSFSYVYQMPGSATLDREQMRSFKRAWAQIDVERTGYIKRKDCARFLSMLNGVFEVRLYPTEYNVPHLLSTCAATQGNSKEVETSARHAVDVRKLQSAISQIDFDQVRQRRRQFVRLFFEAKITNERDRGISFTNMLLMLAQTILINDEDALQVDELLVRREKMEQVNDLVNLDRVRGLLRAIYWRRKFQHYREEKARAAAAEAGRAVPAIVLPDTSSPNAPRTPSLADEPLQPTRSPWGTPTHTPPGSRPTSPISPVRSRPSSSSRPKPGRQGSGPNPQRPARQGSGPSRQGTGSSGRFPSRQGTGSSGPSRSGTLDLDPFEGLSGDGHFTLGSAGSHSTVLGPLGILSMPPSHLSHSSQTLNPSRRGSADSAAFSGSQHLSNYSAYSHSREPSFDEPANEDVLAAMAGSEWADMMREAVDEEGGS